ncbi:hypothetical protein EC968_009646, partial [Mortierella alpina]
MNSVLRTLDDLKSQFSILSWTRDSKASEQAIATLESKVMELTKEKEYLQQELLKRVMAPPTALETQVAQLTKEKAALQQELLQRIMAAAPIPLETKVLQPAREKEAAQQELLQRNMAPAPIDLETKVLQLTREKEAPQQDLVQRIMAPSAQPNNPLVEPHSTGSTLTPPSTVNQARGNPLEKPDDDHMLDLTDDMEIDPVPPPNPICGKHANVSGAGSSKPTARKVAKPRSTKKPASSKVNDLSQVEIRNISTNPYIPCISDPDI